MNRRDEAALRESEATYRTIFETAREGICQVDEQFNITLANQRMADMLGYTVEEIHGRYLFDFITDCQTHDVRQSGAEHRQSFLEKFDCCLRRKNGSEIWAIVSGKPIMSEDHQFSHGVVMITDITERKQAEEALRQSEERFRQMFYRHNAIMLLIEPESGRIIDANLAAEKFYGYKTNELFNMSVTDINPMPPEMIAVERKLALTEKKNYFIFPHKLADGEIRTVEVHSSPMVVNNKQLLFSIIHDITERKQAEAALQKSEWKYRTVADFTYDWEFWLESDGKYVYVSPACERITGYTSAEFQASPDLMTEIVHPDDKKKWVKHLTISKTIALANQIEFRIIARDGTQRWIGHVCQPVYNSDGNYLGQRGSNRDITEQKQAEMNLRESEERFRTLTHLAPVGVYLTDSEGRCQYVNERWLDMSGMTLEESLGDGWINGVHPDDRRLVFAKWQQMVESHGAWGLEYRFQTPGGKITWVLGLATGLCNSLNEKIGYIGVNTDITERKHIEETLRHSEEQYRTLVETMSEGVVVSNKEMTIAYVNDQFCRISGYEKEELIGKTVAYYFDEGNQIIIREQFLKRMHGESGVYEVELTRKDGSKLFAAISAKPVFDSENSFQGSLAVISDITLRKETDTMFLTEHQAMKTQVETTMTQIDNLNMEIQGYNHALKVLLKNAKEDQKTVEENIVSNVREMVVPFLEKMKHTRLSETQKSLLDVIENNLNNVISPFISRLKAQMRDFTPMEIQVANLVREGKTNIEIGDILAISEYTAMFHRKNIRKKLGLQHQSINLRTYLLSMSMP